MDFNFWTQHFAESSLLAKGIYLVLFGLSVSAWAIMAHKLILIRRNGRGTRQFLEQYRKGRRDLLGLHRQIGQGRSRIVSPLVSIFTRGCEDLFAQLGREPGPAATMTGAGRAKITPLQFSTLVKSVSAAEDKYFLDLEHLMIILATTISAAPFLGLLGTVWGILEAFQSMGSQGSTGVTAVGSGISEALIATAFGLLVAIPALLGYNFLGARIRELAGEADQFAADFLALIEREYVRE